MTLTNLAIIDNYMKVQVVTVDRAGGKKLCVQVVWQENGKTKKQNKEVFGLNEKRKAEALRNKLENSEKIDAVDQKITFTDAFNSYIKVLEKNPLNTPEYSMHQVGYINNHIAPYINKQYLSEYLLSDFKEDTLPKILKSKKTAWRTKDGRNYYIRLNQSIGKKTIKEVVGEFKKFIKFCQSHQWKTDYSIANFTFQKNFFINYVEEQKWMPSSKDLLSVINQEKDPKLKALYKGAAETGARLSEWLAICYDDVDFNNHSILLQHSLDKWNEFRPFELKTGKRRIEVTDELLNLLATWMKLQTFPKKHRTKVGSFVRVFNLTKARAAKKVKQSAKKLGIDWQNGLSPFRKFSISAMKDLNVLTDKQMMQRYGNNIETQNKWYYKDLNLNEKERKAAINQITKG